MDTSLDDKRRERDFSFRRYKVGSKRQREMEKLETYKVDHNYELPKSPLYFSPYHPHNL